jgi:hypothetical protein
MLRRTTLAAVAVASVTTGLSLGIAHADSGPASAPSALGASCYAYARSDDQAGAACKAAIEAGDLHMATYGPGDVASSHTSR